MIRKSFDIYIKLKRILNARQTAYFYFTVVCSVIAAFLETIGVSIIVPFIQAILNPGVLLSYKPFANICDIMNINSDRGVTSLIVMGVIIIYIIKNIYFIFFSWIKVKFASIVKLETSVNMLNSYIKSGYEFFLNHNYNELNEGVSGDIECLYYVIINIINGITQMIVVAFICIYLFLIDVRLTLGIICAVSGCLFSILVVFKNSLTAAGNRVREYSIIKNRIFKEVVYGIRDVLSRRKQDYYVSQYEKNMMLQQGAEIVKVVGAESPAYVIEAICVFSIMIIIGIRVQGNYNSVDFIAVLASFAVGAFRILPAMGKISMSMNQIMSSLAGFYAVCDNLLNIDWQDTSNIDKKNENIHATFENCIEIRNVSFSYKTGEKAVLDDISLKVKKGEAVAIIGESGAGKSTIADILLGVLKPQKGCVLTDGVNIENVMDFWGGIVGFVPQNIYLSDVTIRENVAFGISEELIEDKLVYECLEKANIREFIERLEKGVYTKIGDQGIRLSGGQRQRIGIARALYHNPKILILDEATSALDSETEHAVMDAVESLHGEMTMVVIAHRLSTIGTCDKIYEVYRGSIRERRYEDVIVSDYNLRKT